MKHMFAVVIFVFGVIVALPMSAGSRDKVSRSDHWSGVQLGPSAARRQGGSG
jgi:hypothetical protein